MWVPKSIFITSSYFNTVLSPAFGVKCAAQWFREQPVGKAIPASSPFASIIFLDVDSSVSQILVQVIPGFIYSCMYFLVCLWASADCLKSFQSDSYSSAVFSVAPFCDWSVAGNLVLHQGEISRY